MVPQINKDLQFTIEKWLRNPNAKENDKSQPLVLFEINVTYQGRSFVIYRRYTDFLVLHDNFTKRKDDPIIEISKTFPPKLFGDSNLDSIQLEYRRSILQDFLDKVSLYHNRIVAQTISAELFERFLTIQVKTKIKF